MRASQDHPTDRIGQRVLGGIIALVCGLLVGLVTALLVVGFGDGALVLGGAIALGVTVLGVLLPTPFLMVGSIVGSLLGDLVS